MISPDKNDRSADPILLSSEEVKSWRAPSLQVQQHYVPPLDGRLDDRKGFDQFIADEVQLILQKHYPGYPWKAECNSKQGVLWFAIPILMGETLKWVIRLAQWSDLNPKLIRDGAGELLERLNLRRGIISIGEFADQQRNKHRADFSGIR
jgi:hypothetical protein